MKEIENNGGPEVETQSVVMCLRQTVDWEKLLT